MRLYFPRDAAAATTTMGEADDGQHHVAMDMERVSSFSSPRRVVPFPYEQPPGYDDLNLIAHNHLPDDNRKEEEEDDQRWNQEDNWLPITESRKGNTLTAAFHLICSGIGFQTLMLPVAFISLGWYV